MTPRKLKLIGCEVITREALHLAATSPHKVDVQFIRKGLHDLETPDMVASVQEAVDAVDPDAGYDAILLGYARCNDGLVGVTARNIPLVLPRAHDCISFFLGSAGAYREYFDAHPGTYYYTTGWMERGGEFDGASQPGQKTEGVMARLGLTESYEQLVAKHGKENADFIVESLGDWRESYTNLLYIEMGVCDETPFIEDARARAEKNNWQFEVRKGSLELLRKLLWGEWDDDVLILQPGQHAVARNDERILDVEGPE